MRHPARLLPYEGLVTGLDALIYEGYVNVAIDGPLALHVYSKSAVYDRAWNEPLGPFLRMARGLVLDRESKAVVATPFPKFFGVNDPDAGSIPDESFEVFDKLDGSLCVCFFHGGVWRCATKGSFTSEQALWGQARLREINTSTPGVLVPGTTYCCEAIYPENRIVVSYAPEHTGLWLLAAYDSDGRELSYEELYTVSAATRYKLRLVPRRPFVSIAELLERARTLPPDEEGWVLRFASGLRLKLKGDAYLAIHRAVSRLTPLTVWEALASRDPTLVETMRQTLPEEFWVDFDRIRSLLWVAYTEHDVALRELVDETDGLSDKELGLMLQNSAIRSIGGASFGSTPLSRLLFAARKQPNRLPPKLWALVRPTGNRLEGYTPTSGVSRIQEDAA